MQVTHLRKNLDRLYRAGGTIAAASLVAVLLLVLLQMLARWTGEVFPGAPDYAGYCMAAASFFGFAYTLRQGGHIRVAILLNGLAPRHRRWAELWCLAVGSALGWALAWFASKAVYWSWRFGDVSQGLDATPLWIPQCAMAAGALLLAVALTDSLFETLLGGSSRRDRHG